MTTTTSLNEPQELTIASAIDVCYLVGLGGVGSILAEPLCRFLFFTNPDLPVVLVDGDHYELSNQTRQLFDPSADQQNKAEYHGQRLLQYGLNVSHHSNYMSIDYLDHTVSRYQCPLIIAAVDNDATRAMMLRRLEANHSSFFWISPANGTVEEGNPRHAQVLFWAKIDNQPVGLDPRALYQNLRNPMDFVPRKNSCIEKAESDTQVITANFTAAAMALQTVDNLFHMKPLYTSVELDYGLSAILPSNAIAEYLANN